jgi:SAM-dependent methyltransferase
MQPTVPAEVSPDTPLAGLNLNWTERDLPERERTKHVHRLHPYLGKFIPQLVEVFLRKYFTAGQTVLDPFCGSGTTLIQANELGIHAVGYDISAFNVLLSRAKCARYDLRAARAEVADILERVRLATRQNPHQPAGKEEDLPESRSAPDSAYLQRWFAPQARRELLAYRRFIETGGYVYQDLLKVILCRSARSARLTTHFDLDSPRRPQTEPYWCYKHSRKCRPTTEAFKFLKRYSLDTLRRIEQFAAVRTAAVITIHHADSRHADFPPIDGVVTSPPYVGLIDYHEQHAYAYALLGLRDRRSDEIGPAARGTGKKARSQYVSDIASVFRRAAQRMPGGGRLIVVAHDRANLYGEIVRLAGLEVEGVVQRRVNRRTGLRASSFSESVFIWRKP